MILFIMCGIPASGKSTFAQMLADSGVAEVVSTDQIRKGLFGDENCQDAPQKVFNEAFSQINYLGKEHNIIFDATNITSKARRKVIKECGQTFDKIICFYCPCSIKKALAQNAARSRQVPDEVIKRMAEQLQMPTKDEGFDYVSALNIN